MFLDTVRAAHTGHWDVLDALWWQAHPASPGPSGAPSPSASLRDLQRQAFSADGDAIGDQATAQRIRALETEIRDESRAIINALEAAHGRSRTGAASSLGDVAPPSESSQEPLASPDEVTTTPPPGNRRRFVVAAGIAAALALGVVVGAQLTDGSADAVPSRATSPSLPAKPLAAAVSVFERAQTPEDVPDQRVPSTFDPGSFRSLGVIAGTSTSADRVSLYAARSTSNMICVVALAAQIGHLATCALAGDFPTTGLRLYWESEVAIQSAYGSSTTSAMDRYVVWKYDGSVDGGGIERIPAP